MRLWMRVAAPGSPCQDFLYLCAAWLPKSFWTCNRRRWKITFLRQSHIDGKTCNQLVTESWRDKTWNLGHVNDEEVVSREHRKSCLQVWGLLQLRHMVCKVRIAIWRANERDPHHLNGDPFCYAQRNEGEAERGRYEADMKDWKHSSQRYEQDSSGLQRATVCTQACFLEITCQIQRSQNSKIDREQKPTRVNTEHITDRNNETKSYAVDQPN